MEQKRLNQKIMFMERLMNNVVARERETFAASDSTIKEQGNAMQWVHLLRTNEMSL